MFYKSLIVFVLLTTPSFAITLYECSDGFLVENPLDCKESN